MKRFLTLLVVLIVVLTSCNSGSKHKDTPTQMEVVMSIHDEVMPKMGIVGKLAKELKVKIDSTENSEEYEKAMKDLQEAHKAMMDWMKGFGERFNHEEILKGKPLSTQKKIWLNEEEIKVKVMRDKVNNSIKNAEKILGK